MEMKKGIDLDFEEVKNNESKNFYLIVYNQIKEGVRPSIICKRFNISKQKLNYYLSSLKRSGCVKKIGYGVWEISGEFDEKKVKETTRITKYQPVKIKPDFVRGHAFQFKLKIPKLRNWEKREDVLKKKGIKFREPLLPLLTGLFGASNLIISIKQKTKIPIQRTTKLINIRLSKKSIVKTSLASIIAAPFTAFLPGLGASQAALIGKQFLNIEDQREFLFLLGAINTIVMGLSFVALYSIQRTRTGAAVAISKLLPDITLNNLSLIVITIIISGIFAFALTLYISKIVSRNIHKIKYSKLSLAILIILFIIVLIFSDQTLLGKFLSLQLFITSTSLGIFTISSGIKRMHLMGCLLIPTILFYLL